MTPEIYLYVTVGARAVDGSPREVPEGYEQSSEISPWGSYQARRLVTEQDEPKPPDP